MTPVVLRPSSSGIQSDADIIEEFKREIGL